jgi:hypothetical protein
MQLPYCSNVHEAMRWGTLLKEFGTTALKDLKDNLDPCRRRLRKDYLVLSERIIHPLFTLLNGESLSIRLGRKIGRRPGTEDGAAVFVDRV